MQDDKQRYLDLLTQLEAALRRLREILIAHTACPSCRLCLDVQGMVDTLDVFFEIHFHNWGLAAPDAARPDIPFVIEHQGPAS